MKHTKKRPMDDPDAPESGSKKLRGSNQEDEVVMSNKLLSNEKTKSVKKAVHFQLHTDNNAPSIDNEEQDESTEVSELPPKFPLQINSTTEQNNDGHSQNTKSSTTHAVQTTDLMQSPGFLGTDNSIKGTNIKGYRSFWTVPIVILLVLGIIGTSGFATSKQSTDNSDHLIPPNHGRKLPVRSTKTLRDFLLDAEGFHLGMAPAFFGYYGYFGALAAWDDELSNSSFPMLKQNIKSVAGASAGAMAAVLIASGIPPKIAAEFCSTITLGDFADPPGLLTVFRGDKFEEIMQSFMASQNPGSSLLLEDSIIPVAVSGYDLLTMEGKLLTRGSMARAARASACFPVLFQPVGWVNKNETFLLIDGGLADYAGLNGLGAFGADTNGKKKRVVNIVVGEFQFGNVLGPSSMPEGVEASEVVSISIQGLPQCGPWAMESGPRAVTAARLAMVDALDLPMFHGKEEGHYELHIDASSYVPPSAEK